ncbi:PA0069 family radical SAM protein [Ascidiaceihabitans sp.]|uniref:PA0069 family radical SAM protein n=1 Tax=Ascidiaceihabitans sp. TaxID=1872644 RepID=UPI003296FCC9
MTEFDARGRAAQSNRAGRFETLQRDSIDDGWGREAPSVLRTHVRLERPRSVISYNRSPDLPFDRAINPYRGCEHGCVYCFARPSHAYLGLSPGLDFESRLIARPEAPQILERELAVKSYKVATLALGTNTDPYQALEKTHGITRRILQVLQACQHPVAIVTKGALIERDIDILKDMATRNLVRVGISVTTMDPKLSRLMEPRAPSPARRLQIIERLANAGIPVRIMASPMIPALSDHDLEAILEAGRDAGAAHASWIMLRLPREVSELFQEWLGTHYPDRASRILARLREMHGGALYDAAWGKRMRGEGPYAEMVAKRFAIAVRRLGLQTEGAALRTDLFRAPVLPGAQMSFL